MLAALHFVFNIREKSLHDRFFGIVLIVYLIHNSFFFIVFLIDHQQYSYLDRAAPFSLFYGPAIYMMYQTKVKSELSLKTIILHFTPVILFWVLFFYFAVDENLRYKINVWYYPLVYGAIGISMLSYSAYVLFVGRKFRMMLSSINYFAWFLTFSGLFMMTISYLMIKTQSHTSYSPVRESAAVTVAVFMCMGAIILVSDSFRRFEAQFFPTRKKDRITPESKFTKTEKINLSDAKPSNSPTWEHLEFDTKKIEEFFNSDHIRNPDLDLKLAAKILDISQKTLKEQIQVHFRSTFAKILISKRIDSACKILESKKFNDEFDSLSNQCGFNSQATFYRNFKTLKGCTPSQFRASFLNNSK